jgi:response regulator RpfG family c-di-GMP phosphodiesterase
LRYRTQTVEGWRRFEVSQRRHVDRAKSRSWRAPRELRHGTSPAPQEIKVRSDRLDGILLELDMSETHVWVFRAETIFELACTFELRPEETAGHLRRMSSYCEILCKQVQFSFENCEMVRLASQLHDVGNAMISGELLLKCGKLTPREYETVKTTPTLDTEYSPVAHPRSSRSAP